jgi:phosphate-selective porin
MSEPRWCPARVGRRRCLFTATASAQTSGGAAPATLPEVPTPASPVPKATFYGFVQAHYRHAFETGEDGVFDAPNFRVQRVRLGLKGDLYPWLSYEVEIDPQAPEVTGLLRDAFLAFKFIPRHQLRVGQQKTQFGYENRESSSDLFVVNRSEVSDALSRGVNLRDIGVGLVGNIRLGKGWRFEDAITVVNGDGLNVQADSTRRKNVGVGWDSAIVATRRTSPCASASRVPVATGSPRASTRSIRPTTTWRSSAVRGPTSRSTPARSWSSRSK